MKQLSIFCVLAFWQKAVLVSSVDPVLEAVIDNIIENVYLPSSNVPGIGISVIKDGELVLSKGYGYRNLEKGLPVNNKTLFSIGSVTKTVVATVTVKVLSEKFPELGQVVLETPIAKLAPNFNFSFSDRYRAENVAFRDLLAHRLCLYNTGVSLYVGATKTAEEFNYRQRYQEEVCPFRMGSFVYSNSLYGFVGEIIAHISGSSFDELIGNFMKEIGMDDAVIMSSDGSHESLPELAQGYYWKDNKNSPFNMKLTRRITVCKGAGAILASMDDMAAFMKLHLNLGQVGDRQIIRPEVLLWMYDVSSIPGPFFVDKHEENQPVTGVYGYGLGLVLGLLDGWKWLQHGGFYPPYRSKISIFPTKNIAIFTSGNQESSNNEFTHDLIHVAAFQALQAETSQLNITNVSEKLQKLSQTETLSWNIKVKDKLLPSAAKNQVFDQINLVGTYGNPADGELEIVFDNTTEQLKIHYGEWGNGSLIQSSANAYAIEWETDINHHFYANSPFIPNFVADFSVINTLSLEIDEGLISVFVRNITLDSLPIIPWAPDSCGPRSKSDEL